MPTELSPIGVDFLKWSIGSMFKATKLFTHHYHLLHDAPSDVPAKEPNNEGNDHNTHAPPTDCLNKQATMGHGCPCESTLKGISKL